MAVYRTPDERFRDLPGYPFQPHYVEIGGMRVHYVDEGQGPPVLMLHGEPTWSYLYRKMIPPIARRYRAVAPDYVGFGRSDKWTEVEKYAFDAHYRVVERFIEALDLRDITIVVQDWGGPLGLRFATQHPERMARLVILNTGLFTGAVVASRACATGASKRRGRRTCRWGASSSGRSTTATWPPRTLCAPTMPPSLPGVEGGGAGLPRHHPDQPGGAGGPGDDGDAGGAGSLGQAGPGDVQRPGPHLPRGGRPSLSAAHPRCPVQGHRGGRPLLARGEGEAIAAEMLSFMGAR